MIIYPAIDIIGGKAVRLFKGDYNKMTVYSDRPEEIALDFKNCGAERIHIVDLEGAKDGTTPNLETVLKIKKTSGLFCEIGGGIRSIETVEKYLSSGIDRVILGTAAVKDEEFLRAAVSKYGEQIAVGIDVKDGYVCVSGWLENTGIEFKSFCKKMEEIGVKSIIVTDISKDGAMIRTNREMYRELSETSSLDITASGGVSSIDDVKALKQLGIHGAIIGKAYYTKAIDLKEAVEVASC